jgi:hypothetical protein
MENTITRISDLPTDGASNANAYSPIIPSSTATSGKNASNAGGLPTNYMPINNHPNPYGNSTQNNIMPNPQQTQQQPHMHQSQQFHQPVPPPQSQYLTEEQQMQISNLQHQRLPSRDIHQDTTVYAQDPQIQPNYIPKPNVSSDYVRDYENMTEKNVREYEAKKQQMSRLDYILNEIQTPIFIAILFFLFQMPMINTMIFKRFSFLSIHTDDGNFNFGGLLFKSILFGSAYYSMYKFTTFLSEI